MYRTHYHLPLISHSWQHSRVRLAVWISPRFCDTVSSLVFFTIAVYVYCTPILVHVFCVLCFLVRFMCCQLLYFYHSVWGAGPHSKCLSNLVGPVHVLSTTVFMQLFYEQIKMMMTKKKNHRAKYTVRICYAGRP